MRKPLAMVAGAAARRERAGWLPLEQAGVGRARDVPHARRSRASTWWSRTSTGRVLAYRDRCAACDASLREAELAGPLLTCAACGCTFDLPRAGRASDGEAQLDPVPLLRRDGRVFEVALA